MASWVAEAPSLRESIKGEVLLPGDRGYDESITRWSIACIKPAVSMPRPRNFLDDVRPLTSLRQ